MMTPDLQSDLDIDLVVKFGGAAITEKSSLETLRPEALHQGAQLLQQCHEGGQTVVVVHGAGSFGHHHAAQYSVNKGFDDVGDRSQTLIGFGQTRLSVTKLNRLVVGELLRCKVPAVGTSPFPSWQTEMRQVCQWPREAIVSVLTSGLVPVFHGDCVLDMQQGCCILSGDTIIKTLCQKFNVKRVVFLTDVDGVYDKPPCEPGAKLLKQISVSPEGGMSGIHGVKGTQAPGNGSGIATQACNIQTSVTDKCETKVMNTRHDVTGGMLTKLRAAQDIARESQGKTRVFVCKIGSMDASRLCVDRVDDVSDLNATEIVPTTDRWI